MGKARYRFVEELDNRYSLFEDDMLLIPFRRETFQRDLGSLGRGSGWVGSILRLFNRYYPPSQENGFVESSRIDFLDRPHTSVSPENELRRLIRAIGHRGIAEYLRLKGYTVYRPVSVQDRDLVEYLRTVGYTVEGTKADDLEGLCSGELARDGLGR